MGNPSFLSRLPVLRLLLPLVMGILLFRLMPDAWLPIVLLVVAVVALIVLAVARKSPAVALALRAVHIIPLSMFMMAVGWLAAFLAMPPELDVKAVNGKAVLARVEHIDYHERSMEMQVQLLGLGDDSSQLPAARILLSTSGCDYELVPGDMIAFLLNIQPVKNLGNPDEMDYASHLYHKGIRYRQHTKLAEVVKTGSSPTLMTR